MKRRGRGRHIVARLRLPAIWMSRAADHDGVGDLGRRPARWPRRGCRSRRRPARFTCAWMRGIICADRGGVEVAGAGHALQRHVVDVAAGDAADLLRCAASVEVGASRKIGSMPCALAAARRSPRIPRAGSRRRARRRRRPPPRRATKRVDAVALDRVGIAHQHDRRAASFAGAEVAHRRRAPARMPMPRASARSPAFWITGPSAIGSENGTPSSITSAPAVDHRVHQLGRGVGIRVAGGDVGDQRLAALRRCRRCEGGGDAAHARPPFTLWPRIDGRQ